MLSLGSVGLVPPMSVGARAAAPAEADASAAAQASGEPGEPQRGADPDRLQDPSLQREIAALAARDREVRAHEQAHMAAGGALITSGPSYTYQTGPDQRRYAVGGEVGIDTSPVRGDPEATLDKARRIRAAALAPADPSSQDIQVAARASQMEQTARAELVRQQRDQAYRGTAEAGREDDPAPRLSAVA